MRATLLSNRATTLLKVHYPTICESGKVLIRLQLDRHEDALSDTEASLTLYPTSFKALRTRARLNLHFEKYDTSISDFKSAIQQAQTEGSDGDVRALRTELKKAEAALKRSKTKDYYKILGVARDCNESDIKKGYRRESLKHHPDKVSFPRFSHSYLSTECLARAATKRSSNWSLKPTLYSLILIDERDTIWARTKMV